MDSSSLKVLLIEDNPGDARLIREMLAPLSHRFLIEHVQRLNEGLERLSRGDFAVVLLDLVLIETQGMETFHKVRQHTPGTPIVVLTGANDEALAAEALQAGAQDYLVKGQVDQNLLSRSLQYAVERGRIEEQLRHRAAELAESNRRKDEFIAILSHELRNPLSPLNMVAELLRKPALDAHDIEMAQSVIERQVRTMTRLIDDLLDISRITRGKIVLRKEPMDLSVAIKRAVDATASLIQEHSHELNVSLPAEPLWMEGDVVRIEQVMVNLLTNAARYTPPHGTVRVSASHEGTNAIVRVRDSGIGIPPEMLDRIFDLFTQVDSSISRPSQWGMGVGLALVRELVEMHGGAVKASSAGSGHGSEFLLRFPLLAGAREAEVRPSPSTLAAVAVAVTAADGRRQSVLIVEDHQESATCLARLLQSWGHDVRVAPDGPAALAAAREFLPEVVLLDIGLPGLDGYAVARAMRQDAQFASTLLVALTGYGRQEDRHRASEAGFDFHLTKPVDADALRQLFSTATRNPQQADA